VIKVIWIVIKVIWIGFSELLGLAYMLLESMRFGFREGRIQCIHAYGYYPKHSNKDVIDCQRGFLGNLLYEIYIPFQIRVDPVQVGIVSETTFGRC
jgi:hypothetical protein